jgi:hypothetical protein
MRRRSSSRYDCLGAGLQRVGVRFPVRARFFSSPTQPPIKWVPGAFSPGVKRSWREADHSPPTSAEVKNTWTYTSSWHSGYLVNTGTTSTCYFYWVRYWGSCGTIPDEACKYTSTHICFCYHRHYCRHHHYHHNQHCKLIFLVTYLAYWNHDSETLKGMKIVVVNLIAKVVEEFLIMIPGFSLVSHSTRWGPVGFHNHLPWKYFPL